jgi:hypothetical protein
MYSFLISNYLIPDTYIWDKKTKKWQYKNGREVSKNNIDKLYSKIYQTLETKNKQLIDKLVNKEITLNQWKAQFFSNLKLAEINVFLLTIGGAENLVNKDTKILNNNVKKKFTYFSKFVNDIKKGVSEKELRYRSERYNKSVESAISSGNLLNKKRTGFNFAYRRLGIAEHCKDCIYYNSLGVVGIDEFTPIKTNCICQERCKCSEYFFSTLEDAVKSFNQ